MLLQAKRLGGITNEPFDRLHGKAGGQERCWINVLLAVMILIASPATSGPVTSPGGKELRQVVAESAEAGACPAGSQEPALSSRWPYSSSGEFSVVTGRPRAAQPG